MLVTDSKKIWGAIEGFYSGLYKKDDLEPSKNLMNTFLENPLMPRLSVDDSQVCEGKLTIEECVKSLNSFEPNKSPGNDGLTVEFYKFFWNIVGELLVASLNYSYDVGELSNSQKKAIIILLHGKKDKDKRHISNWRPISLINVDVKIGSKAIAKRLAFDSVSREFLFRTPSAARFSSSFIQWVHTFYNNIYSCVSNNGFATAHFDIQRGVRQGDPLSPYLFIIVLETLASTIRSDNDIRGIMVDGQEIKLGLFADDLPWFLKNDKALKKFLELVLLFGKCSGLVINHNKSEILLLRNSFPAPPNLDHTPLKDLKIKISVKILGVYFTYDHRLRRKLNFDEITKTIKDKLRIWKWRDLTIIGRIQLVKTFIIPTFLYRASLICMDKEFVNEVNKIIFDFIWKGKDKVKRRVLVGTLRMED